MKKFVILLITFMCANSYALDCNQPENVNACAFEDFKAENAKLNNLFTQLKIKYKTSPAYIKIINDAIKKWEDFRESQVKLVFPGINEMDGSVVSACEQLERKDLTHDLVVRLGSMIKKSNSDEGDVCYARFPE